MMEDIICTVIDHNNKDDMAEHAPLEAFGLFVCLRPSHLKKDQQKTLFRYERRLSEIVWPRKGNRTDHDPYIRQDDLKSPLTIVFRFPPGFPDSFNLPDEMCSLEYSIYARDADGILHAVPIFKTTITELQAASLGKRGIDAFCPLHRHLLSPVVQNTRLFEEELGETFKQTWE